MGCRSAYEKKGGGLLNPAPGSVSAPESLELLTRDGNEC